ncbi:MAG: type II toxin-antitoxin system PemK/MazF family toxin [Candidatus Omnitrophica bacterium]|nr:type II toxin-antitoxin system PemK/MazF family toxin [Candidatus Omnitrophota bacterium]MBU4589311.1 type II toxin-antitoxin system PemK/MazF family toxin [Candidatus Omnitrophota bacterium]
MRKGEVWWADLPPPIGRRPVVLLSRNEACSFRTHITFASVSTTLRNLPVEVVLTKEDGLLKTSAVNLDSIYTFNKRCLKQKICLLKPEKIAQINSAVKFALAL